MCDIKALTSGNCGKTVSAGTTAVLYLTSAEELNGFPQTQFEKTAATTPGAKLTLDDAFDFSTAPVGKGYWRKYPIMIDYSMIEAKTAGELGNISFGNNLPFFLIGTNAEVREFAMTIANCCIVALIETREGEISVIGRDNDPAHVSEITISTQKKVGESSGAAFNLQCNNGKPWYTYPKSLGIDVLPNV